MGAQGGREIRQHKGGLNIDQQVRQIDGQGIRMSEMALGQVGGWTVNVGSRPGDLIFTMGWNISTTIPSMVVCQARQSENLDHGWPDQFAIQVIQTSRDFLVFRVHRLDVPGGGWGQNLRVDVLIIE